MIMNIKNCLILSLLHIFFIISCSSLDIQRRETDLFREKLEADGKEPRSATPIAEFFPDIFGDNYNLNVNSITFEVALKKFSVMPIMTADKNSGIITTDWFSTANNSNERFKFNIIIKDDA